MTDTTRLPDQPPHLRTAVLACLPAFVLALYPLAVVVGANVAVLPLSTATIVRDTALILSLTAILLWSLKLVFAALVPRGMWLGTVMLLFCSYGGVVSLAAWAGVVVDPASRKLAAAYTLGCLVVATAVVRPRQTRARHPLPLNVIAAALIVLNVIAVVVRRGDVAWRPVADALIESKTGTPSKAPHVEPRDIYYIVLDGFGRSDVLRRYYGVDLESFVGFLRSRGFFVPERARSNYSQTYLSLASTLNLEYLDDLARALEAGAQDRRPLAHLIRFNGLMKIARDAGYEVVVIGSNYEATKRIDRADRCICDQHGLDALEQAALSLTPLGALPLGRWTHDAHRRKVLDAFAALAERPAPGRPRLVFAHIISPHPPFLFAPDGSPRQPGGLMAEFFDGDNFNGSTAEYVSGYRDQVLFVTRRLTALVEHLLGRPGPAPAIVFHGDHGPGSMLWWEDAEATNLEERMSIFAAYYLPGDGPALYPSLSPVNGARALASRYFGVDLPFLPERAVFSTWSRPYEFIEVGPDERPVESAP